MWDVGEVFLGVCCCEEVGLFVGVDWVVGELYVLGCVEVGCLFLYVGDYVEEVVFVWRV